MRVEVEAGGGQAANSQFGPVRPTAEPSGQSFASIVQAVGAGCLGIGMHETPINAKTNKSVAVFG